MTTAPLQLIIRFGGQPLADMPLTALASTTVAALKSEIRIRMLASYDEHSIKLIYNGRQLRNQLSVGQELNVKNVARGDAPNYVHCALPMARDQNFESAAARATFGDPTVLRRDDDMGSLGTDAVSRTTEAVTRREGFTQEVTDTEPSDSMAAASALPRTPPAPAVQLRGLDRLRTIPSFTAAEVTALRTQFRANIAVRHTPTTMPSEQQLLQMEERWLDGSAFSSSLAAVSAGSSAPRAASLTHAEGGRMQGHSELDARTDGVDLDTGDGIAAAVAADAALGFEAGQQLASPPAAELEAEDDAAQALDDTLLGVLTGFFWPIGAVVWGMREDGVWSRRRGWSVLAGVLVNLTFGLVRVMG